MKQRILYETHTRLFLLWEILTLPMLKPFIRKITQVQPVFILTNWNSQIASQGKILTKRQFSGTYALHGWITCTQLVPESVRQVFSERGAFVAQYTNEARDVPEQADEHKACSRNEALRSCFSISTFARWRKHRFNVVQALKQAVEGCSLKQ